MFPFLNPKIDAFGIDISDLSIKIAKLEKKRGGFVLASFGRQNIPDGVIDMGEIKKESDLISVIRSAVRDVEGEPLKTNYVICSLPEQEAFIRVIQLPRMEQSELRQAVKWELEAHIPLKIDDVYFDYFIVKPVSNHIDHIDVLIGALPKKIVDDYVDVLKKSGLGIKAMEIESVATARSLVERGFSSESILIIDLGWRRTSFTIFSGRAPRLTSSSQISNYYLIKVLAENLKLDIEAAKRLKFEIGLEDEKFGGKITKALEASLSILVGEIKKYIEFYESHATHEHGAGGRVQEIILCGGGANLAGLSVFLSKKTGLSVRLGNPWINIFTEPLKEVPPISYNESLGYTTALGLALYGIK